MPPRLREQAPIFAALGDETRLRIVLRLADEGPQSITRLTEGTAVTRQAITKHLVVLADAGIVRGKKRGREHLWEVELDSHRLGHDVEPASHLLAEAAGFEVEAVAFPALLAGH